MTLTPELFCRRNPDAFEAAGAAPDGAQHYHVTRPVPADALLSQMLVSALTERLGAGEVVQGMNASADSFYSSQARSRRSLERAPASACSLMQRAELYQQHPILSAGAANLSKTCGWTACCRVERRRPLRITTTSCCTSWPPATRRC